MPKGDKDILKADPEDGTTPIANLLLEALAIAKLTGKEKGIILYLWRRTYGWERNGKRLKEKAISLSDFGKVCNVDTATSSKLLAGLVKKNILKREFAGAGKGYTYSMNTRVGEWDKGCINHQLLKEISIQPLVKMTTQQLVKTPTPSDTKLATPKEILKKLKESNISNRGKDNKDEAGRIWKECLEILKDKVNQRNFDTWLEGTVGLLYQKTVFIIGVPNEHAGEYLVANQRSLIESALIQVTGKRLGIGYRVVRKEMP